MKKLPLVKDSERYHILTTGSSGSGKTNCIYEIIEQIRTRGDKVVCMDLTGSFVGPYLKQDDLLLNPYDARSVKWLPWADCKLDYDYDALSKTIIGKKSKIDPHWEENAEKILTESLKQLKHIKHDNSTNELMKLINQYSLKAYSKFFANTNVAGLTDAKNDKGTLSSRSVLTNKAHALSYLEDTNSPFSITDYILDQDDTRWLFITATPAQRASLNTLLSVWFNIAINAVLQRNPLGKNKNIWFIVDELPAMGMIPSLSTGLSEVRKYGGCFLAGIQDVHQLFDIYGNHLASHILNQFGTRFIFRSNDEATAYLSSKLLGQQKIEETQESLSYGANTIRDGVNLNTVEKIETLVMPTEIMNLESLSCYVKLYGNWPITKINMPLNKPIIKNELFIAKKNKLQVEPQ